MVGIGALRTDDAQDLARDAAAAGADGLLLAPVSYTPLTDEEVFQHFSAVASVSGLPVCIYNNPGATHFSFSDGLVARLAAVRGISAVKHPAPAPAEAKARVAAARRGLPADFSVGFAADWHAPDAVLAGGAAWYSVIAGLLPRPALALMRAAQAGAEDEVRRLDVGLQPMWDLFRQHGSLRVVYAAANLLGLTGAQPPRPILPLDGAARAHVATALEGLEA
jgi:4-hydroxy-tetrahydrodipicolinate synthase